MKTSPGNNPRIERPYPGTRPFEADESDIFFGREDEILDLTNLLVSQRVVLLHAQSGAGKTSLINAGVLPRLTADWQVRRARVGGSLRGNQASRAVPNVFTANVLSTLPGGSGTSTAAGIASLLPNRPSDQTVLLILDQFEELFTTYQDRWKDREPFFQELATLVGHGPDSGPRGPSSVRLLIVIREEHVARLEPFSRYLPDSLRIRYYLERLREASAIEAIAEPAKKFGQPFCPGVAEDIATKLRRETLYIDTGLSQVSGEFVEPALVQLLCRQLWDRLEADGRRERITREDVERFAQVDETLQTYYERTVAEVVERTGLREGKLRDLFDKKLITSLATRGRALVETDPDVRMREAVRAFEEKHIVRGENYGGAEWCELTHDRFIAPIHASNGQWYGRRRRQRIAWTGFSMLALLATILGLILGLYKVDLQKELLQAYRWSDGEVVSAAYTLLAFQALNQGDWTGASAAADKCIRDFGAEARTQQLERIKERAPAPPVGQPSRAEVKFIAANRILNNVGACLFVKAKAAEHAGRYQEARDLYQMLQEFSYARVWDPAGFFWSPSEGAAEALRTLPQ